MGTSRTGILLAFVPCTSSHPFRSLGKTR